MTSEVPPAPDGTPPVAEPVTDDAPTPSQAIIRRRMKGRPEALHVQLIEPNRCSRVRNKGYFVEDSFRFGADQGEVGVGREYERQ